MSHTDPAASATNQQKSKAFEWLRTLSIGFDDLHSENAAIMMYEVAELKKQRDELLAALIEIQQVSCSGSPDLEIANEAITKAEQV